MCFRNKIRLFHLRSSIRKQANNSISGPRTYPCMSRPQPCSLDWLTRARFIWWFSALLVFGSIYCLVSTFFRRFFSLCTTFLLVLRVALHWRKQPRTTGIAILRAYWAPGASVRASPDEMNPDFFFRNFRKNLEGGSFVHFPGNTERCLNI